MTLYGYRSISGVGLGSGAFGNLNVATTSFVSPAVATDFSVAVPDTGEMWRLIALHAQIVTDANAANRVFNFNIKDHDSKIVYETGITTAITASLTIPITLTPQVASPVGDITAVKRWLVPIPDGPYLPGWTINSVTTAIQVGDQYSQLRAWFIADQPLEEQQSNGG